MRSGRHSILQTALKPIQFLSVSLLLFFGCSNEDLDVTEFRGTIVAGATVNLNCEFIFQTGTTYYVPTFLPAQYKKDGISVFIKGDALADLSACANATGDGRFIRIEQISAGN